ncbi:hypothetical protein EVAR_75860_1 [Eumeta japonica]|uniref:Uncharacterized protein n=1 Tax=Eumeta variegata TaxID=151549 RepID=A0A4C1TFV1_EUMVA|nr:hypothetical protein EVAR_75860_1 [Eumeta japonica]
MISSKFFTNALEDVFKILNWKRYGININVEYLTRLRFADEINHHEKVADGPRHHACKHSHLVIHLIAVVSGSCRRARAPAVARDVARPPGALNEIFVAQVKQTPSSITALETGREVSGSEKGETAHKAARTETASVIQKKTSHILHYLDRHHELKGVLLSPEISEPRP